jgi:hypothetical protein
MPKSWNCPQCLCTSKDMEKKSIWIYLEYRARATARDTEWERARERTEEKGNEENILKHLTTFIDSFLIHQLYFLTWIILLLLFILQYWGLNSGPSPWATPPALFLWRAFWDRVSRTICPGWLQTKSLLINTSWEAWITGVSHQHLAILIAS